jgi:hypothetical protein
MTPEQYNDEMDKAVDEVVALVKQTGVKDPVIFTIALLRMALGGFNEMGYPTAQVDTLITEIRKGQKPPVREVIA